MLLSLTFDMNDAPLRSRWPAALFALLLLGSAAACEAEPESEDEPMEAALADSIVVTGGLQTPESALHDPEADVYLVSNINGGPLEEDGNGFISRISPEGEVLELRWIDGQQAGVTLNAPKGLAVGEGVLYISDIDVVRLFDRATGEPLGAWEVPEADFLNDLSVGPDGAVYVTDTAIRFDESGAVPTGTDAVYRFEPEDGARSVVLQDEALSGPNGIVATGEGALVVTFGADELYRITPDGARTLLAQLPQGQLDGLVRLPGGALLVSSWAAQAIYRVEGDAEEAGAAAVAVVQGVPSPADIGYDETRGRLLIPVFNENRLLILAHP